MTEHERAVLTPQMHTIAFAEREGFAVFTGFRLFHPTPVAIGFELLFPYAPERVFIDIPLIVFAADTGASGDMAVDENRSYRHPRSTLVEVVAHLAFVVA